MWANTEINDFEYEEGGHSIVRNQWRSFNTITRCFIIFSSFISFDSYVLAFLFCVRCCCFWLWNVTCAWYVYRNDSWLRWTHTHACAHVCVCVRVRLKFVYENDQLNHFLCRKSWICLLCSCYFSLNVFYKIVSLVCFSDVRRITGFFNCFFFVFLLFFSSSFLKFKLKRLLTIVHLKEYI